MLVSISCSYRLLELDCSEITVEVKSRLHGVCANLDKMEFKGAQLLLAKLKKGETMKTAL